MARRGTDGLTDKQRRFCDEYLIDLNATQAAIRAGYKEKYADDQAAQLLRKNLVAEYIARRQGEIRAKYAVTQERVVAELAKIAFADQKDFLSFKTAKTVVAWDKDGEPVIDWDLVIDIKDSNQVDGSLIQEISKTHQGFRFKLHDKVRALELLSKHLGLLKEGASTEPIHLKVEIDYENGKRQGD